MPIIYLSPSTQENNLYVNGGSEEYWMNRLADAMVPYLNACGIQYVRNTPTMTAASSIAASNRGSYDLHLALHSNAAPEGKYGQVRGVIVFYYPQSAKGKEASTLIADNIRPLYPLPDKVRIVPTTSIGEVTRVRAVSSFLELGFHDNLQDAIWIKANIEPVARAIVLALTQYFDIPFLSPAPSQQGVVDVDYGNLNIRSRPSLDAPIIAKAYDGAPLTILGQEGDWLLVRFGGETGYAYAEYVTKLRS